MKQHESNITKFQGLKVYELANISPRLLMFPVMSRDANQRPAKPDDGFIEVRDQLTGVLMCRWNPRTMEIEVKTRQRGQTLTLRQKLKTCEPQPAQITA
jgi:hypothetical protein